MSRDIDLKYMPDKRAFTLAEALTTTFIFLYIMLAAWSVYLIGWRWFYEMAPAAEAQRIARIAIASIIDGVTDASAGQETINVTTYGFLNGISGTTLTNTDVSTNPTFATPVISAEGHRIDFKLEKDSAAVNPRAFYLGTDPVSQVNAVYYQEGAGNVRRIDATQGITDLIIEAVPDYANLIKVTAKVQRTVQGTRYEATPIVVEYSDFIYLRSV